MEKKLSIAVIGAGAIGGITAAFLSKAGFDVEIVCKYKEKQEQIQKKGLHIVGVRGEHFVKMKAAAKIEQLSGKKDIVLVVTKAYDMPDAAKRILAFLKKDSIVVSMQNGICTEAMAKIVGEQRTVGCVIGWGATMQDGGVLNMTSEGEFVIGGYLPDKDISQLQEIMQRMMPTRISENIVNDLYSKMIINSCITSTGVLSGLYLGEILKKRVARNIFISIIKEAIGVANAMDLKVMPYGGKLDYYSLIAGQSIFAKLKRHLIIRIMGFKYRRLKSSSLQSLKRGKPTEIDYFNGYIAKKGEELGIAAPVNRRIVEMIKQIEAGKRQISPENFYDEQLHA